MDNMKNGGHAGTAEAENAETMDLLTGMLDAATHCGDNDGDGQGAGKNCRNRRHSGREYAKITAKPTRCCGCKTGKGDSISPLFVTTSRTAGTASDTPIIRFNTRIASHQIN